MEFLSALQVDHSGGRKPPVDMDLECSVNLATVAAHKLPRLSGLSQQEVFFVQNGHREKQDAIPKDMQSLCPHISCGFITLFKALHILLVLTI